MQHPICAAATHVGFCACQGVDTECVVTESMSSFVLICRRKSDDPSSKGSLLRQWASKDPLKQPTCALLVNLVQAMLSNADSFSLTHICSSRQAVFVSCIVTIHTEKVYTVAFHLDQFFANACISPLSFVYMLAPELS